jgi:hypothetical protein
MKKYMSISEFLTDYQERPETYNMLVPVQSIQDVGPMYKPVINMVLLSTDLEDGDIYIQKNAINPETGERYSSKRYSLTKKGLFQIYSAADARFISTKMSRDKEAQTVTCEATMEYHSFSGEWKDITCSKTCETMLTPKSGKAYPDVQAPQKAESQAQNRCIRAAFNIKGHYSLEQLQKPFVAVYIILDETKDRDVKLAKIAAGLGSTNMLFAPRQVRQLESGKNVDTDTGEIVADYEVELVGQQETPPPWQQGKCKGCGANVGEGVELCIKCQTKAGGKAGGK